MFAQSERGFVALTASVYLAMGSASATWAIMAPVLVPMFILSATRPSSCPSVTDRPRRMRQSEVERSGFSRGAMRDARPKAEGR